MGDYNDKKDWKIDQEQRAIFFDEKASEFQLKEIIEKFDEIDPLKYDWDLESLNIGEEAWETIIHSELRPIEVFCHPEVIKQDEHFVLYFQFLAMLSGKSISHLGFSSNYEVNHRRFQNDGDLSEKYAKRINEIVSTLIENKPKNEVVRDNLTIWRSMQAGSTSGGSWRNQKGDLEEIRLKRRIFKEFQERGLISDEKDYESAFGFSIDLEETVYTLDFKSEPDIGIRKNGSEEYDIIVEIKGGIDPAGVLERFGAILKSFRNEISKNPEVSTYLTIQRAAYTDESEKRIESAEEIHQKTLISGLNEEDYEEAAEELVNNFCSELNLC